MGDLEGICIFVILFSLFGECLLTKRDFYARIGVQANGPSGFGTKRE